MKRILLTGATGFVGSHAVEALASEGTLLRALARPSSRTGELERFGVEVMRGSIRDDALLQRACDGVDAVVHLAARLAAPSAAAFDETNVDATRRLLRAARASGVRRFVFMSSVAAAGPSRDGVPVRPEDPPRPVTDYGRSKAAAERVCREEAGPVEVAILRAPAVYGPRDREILRFFRLARTGFVPLPSGPTRPLQLVHAADLARAIALAVSAAGAHGVFHIAEPRAWDMPEVARLIGDAIGRRVRVLPVPPTVIRGIATIAEIANRVVGRTSLVNRDKVRELLAPGWLCETDAARDAFGFEAHIALADGLAATAAWYREHGWLGR